MVFFASLLLLLPGAGLLSAVLAPFFLAPGILGLLIAILMAAVAGQWLLQWPCPRRRNPFARRKGHFAGRLFPRYCVHCRLPEWATAADAIATPPEPVSPTAPGTDAPALPAPSPDSVKRRQRRHRRLGYALAAVAIYVGFCRLPPGNVVKTPSGRQIELVSLSRHFQVTTGGGPLRNLLLQYYTPTPGDTVEARDVLALALDAARETRDSVIVVQQINSSSPLRWLGVRVAYIHRYRQTPTGEWRYAG